MEEAILFSIDGNALGEEVFCVGAAIFEQETDDTDEVLGVGEENGGVGGVDKGAYVLEKGCLGIFGMTGGKRW